MSPLTGPATERRHEESYRDATACSGEWRRSFLPTGVDVEIVICGRNVEVPEHFRDHTNEKLARLGRFDHKVIRMSVELSHENNPRQTKTCQSVEITGRGRGPVVRAVASAGDFYSALDLAVGRLEERMRRSHDRRVHKSARRRVAVGAGGPGEDLPTSGAELDESLPEALREAGDDTDHTDHTDDTAAAGTVPVAREALDDRFDREVDGDGPGHIARVKEHEAVPMTVDDALSRMELVGHDFFLFSDSSSGRPSVVYRRRGYDYGVIHLV